MIKIIKNGEVFGPHSLGKKDIIIVGDKIGALENEFNESIPTVLGVEIIDASGMLVFPGFIDSHVHICGGGGEGSFKTRTPEIVLSDAVKGGVTTIIGCLGTDGITRSMEGLYAKAKGLEEEGISTFILTGSYHVPIGTITGNPMKDMIMIDNVIGAGEIAVSDHRSSHPTTDEIARLASDIRVGGILSGKAGVINVHLGDGKDKLALLQKVIDNTDIPYKQFLPTHINRSEELFIEGMEYAKRGGLVDFTTSSDPIYWEDGEVKASIGLRRCLEGGVPVENITFSSDGQGSMPVFNERKECVGLGIGRVTSLFDEVRDAILKEGVSIEAALKVVTSNPASIYKLGGKGFIGHGTDADLVLVDKTTLEIDTVLSKGKLMMKNKRVMVCGTFE